MSGANVNALGPINQIIRSSSFSQPLITFQHFSFTLVLSHLILFGFCYYSDVIKNKLLGPTNSSLTFWGLSVSLLFGHIPNPVLFQPRNSVQDDDDLRFCSERILSLRLIPSTMYSALYFTSVHLCQDQTVHHNFQNVIISNLQVLLLETLAELQKQRSSTTNRNVTYITNIKTTESLKYPCTP